MTVNLIPNWTFLGEQSFSYTILEDYYTDAVLGAWPIYLVRKGPHSKWESSIKMSYSRASRKLTEPLLLAGLESLIPNYTTVIPRCSQVWKPLLVSGDI